MMDNKVDLNQATVEELAALRGFGLKLAQRIVTYREEVHPFEEVIELTAVPGISERMVREVEDRLTVGTAVASPAELPGVAEAWATADSLVETVESVAEEPLPGATAERPESESDIADLSKPLETVTLKERIEMAESRPEPERSTPPAPVPAPALAPRNRSLVGAIIGAIFGAIIGVVLTLAILSNLNGGTLYFASRDRANELQQELDSDMESVRGEQSSLLGNVETLGGQLATVAAEQVRLDVIEGAVDGLQATAVALEDELTAAEERLDIVAESAENFDAFLNGLRDLLFDFQGAPPTLAVTETATPTPTPVPTETMVVTPTAVATETQTPPPATRTPRPTATPLVTVTATE